MTTQEMTPTAAVAAGETKPLAAECPNCGRAEMVSTIVGNRDENARATDADGKAVPDGSRVHLCALCGYIAQVREKVRTPSGKPKTKKPKPKPKPAARSSSRPSRPTPPPVASGTPGAATTSGAPTSTSTTEGSR